MPVKWTLLSVPQGGSQVLGGLLPELGLNGSRQLLSKLTLPLSAPGSLASLLANGLLGETWTNLVQLQSLLSHRAVFLPKSHVHIHISKWLRLPETAKTPS